LYQGSWAAWESELGGFALMATYFSFYSERKVSKRSAALIRQFSSKSDENALKM